MDYVSKVQIGSGEEVDIKDANAVQKAELFDLIYPVGSIYMSVNSINPGTLFGGTWVNWGAGKVPVGVDDYDPDFNTVESRGGSKSHSYTPAGTNSGGAVQNHTLTVSEMPSHRHSPHGGSSPDFIWAMGLGGVGDLGTISTNVSGGSALSSLDDTKSTGGGGAHNHGFTQPTFTGTAATMSHLQPYITCYMWKRVA